MITLPLDLNRCIPPFAVWEQNLPGRSRKIIYQSFFLKEANEIFEQKRRNLVSGLVALTDGVCHTIRSGARYPRGRNA